ncbi:MAG: DNA damage-inducible protein 1 [Phylliscum demangeonii]|nr:MAG: DNA damage-inducible protein 1 [Phylliscum demangeonii]
MLNIDDEVDGHEVKAFVDSRAQAIITSPSCAETRGIMRLVNKRLAVLRAVSQRRRSSAAAFGPDQDRHALRHQACVDLRRDVLVIPGNNVPFMGEANIPKREEEGVPDEPTVDGPAGMNVDPRSGPITPPGDLVRGRAAPSSSHPDPGPFQDHGLTPADRPPALGRGTSPTTPSGAHAPSSADHATLTSASRPL